MEKLFIPYIDQEPAALCIKGHRVLILTRDSAHAQEQLSLVGGDEIREVQLDTRVEGEGDSESDILADLAATIDGGVVLTPPGTSIAQMIKDLEQELPWIH